MSVHVAVVMGSDSDLVVMADACRVLDELDIPYEVSIVSAHRTPMRMMEFAAEAEARGLRVIIAGAGGAAHLPGMIASLTPLPVIGVPVRASALDGLDSLLSIVQMPRGVPVATVAINNARNAGLLAGRILGVGDATVRESIRAYAASSREEVGAKNDRLTHEGWKAYLARIADSGERRP